MKCSVHQDKCMDGLSQLTLNAKIVSISEVLLKEARPLLAYLANLSLPIRSKHMELHVLPTGAGEEGTFDLQDYLVLRIANGKVWEDEVEPDMVARVQRIHT